MPNQHVHCGLHSFDNLVVLSASACTTKAALKADFAESVVLVYLPDMYLFLVHSCSPQTVMALNRSA